MKRATNLFSAKLLIAILGCRMVCNPVRDKVNFRNHLVERTWQGGLMQQTQTVRLVKTGTITMRYKSMV